MNSVSSIHIFWLLFTGGSVGFVSRVLGIGGRFIMVPVQYWILTSMDVSVKTAILTAFGTNLMVVIPGL